MDAGFISNQAGVDPDSFMEIISSWAPFNYQVSLVDTWPGRKPVVKHSFAYNIQDQFLVNKGCCFFLMGHLYFVMKCIYPDGIVDF